MKKLVLIFIILGLLTGCTDDSNKPSNSNCEKEIFVDDTLFAKAPNHRFNFLNAEIIGDCLEITISYGGGCGEILDRAQFLQEHQQEPFLDRWHLVESRQDVLTETGISP